MTKIAITLSVVDGSAEDSLSLTLDKEEVSEMFKLISDTHWTKEHKDWPEAEFARRLADTILGYSEWAPHTIQEWFDYNSFCQTCGMLLAHDEHLDCTRHGGKVADDEGLENLHE